MAGRCHRIALATRGLHHLHARHRMPCCPPWHARSSSRLLVVLLELLGQSDEHAHRTGNFCTAALAALVVQNGLHCRFASSVASLTRALGPTSSPLRLCVVVGGRQLDDLGHAPWTIDLLLAVRLQSACRVSDSSSLPRRAESGAGPWMASGPLLATDC